MAQERIDIVVGTRGAVVARNQISAIGLAAQGTSAALLQLRRMLLGLGAGVALFRTFTSGVRTMADFSESVRQVQAILGATDNAMEGLIDRFVELGSTTRFTSSQVADAGQILARAGLNMGEINAALESTLLLAIAAGTDIETSANIAVSIMRGMNIEMSRMEEVMDVLALTAARTNTDITQLGQAFKFVAPFAAALDMSVQETAAALGVLADAGLKAEMGGTGLRNVIVRLIGDLPNVRKVIEGMGLTMEDVNLDANKLADVLQLLSENGVSAGEAFQAFMQRGGPAFLNLVSSLEKMGVLTEVLEDADGFLREFVDTVSRSLPEALLRVRSAWEAIFLQIGRAGFEDFLIDKLDKLAERLRWVANNLDEVGRAARDMTPLLIAMFGPMTLRMVIGIAGWVLRFARAFNPLHLAIIAATGAITFFGDKAVAVSESGATIKDVFMETFNFIKGDFVPGAVELLGMFAETSSAKIKEFSLNALEFLGDLAPSFKGIMDRWREDIESGNVTIIGELGSAIARIIAAFAGLSAAITLNWGDMLGTLVTNMKIKFNEMIDTIIDFSLSFRNLVLRIPGASKLLGVTEEDQNLIEFYATGFKFEIPDAAREGANRAANSFKTEFRRVYEDTFDMLTGSDVGENLKEALGVNTIMRRANVNAIVRGFQEEQRSLFADLQAAGIGSAEDFKALEDMMSGGLRRPGATDMSAGAPGPRGAPPPGDRSRTDEARKIFDKQIQQMSDQLLLLNETGRARDRLTQVLSLQERMERELTDTEAEQLRIMQDKLFALQDQAAILDEIQGPQERYARTQEALNALFERGAINLQEYNRRMAEARIEVLQAATDLESGLERGLLRIGLEFSDVATLAEQTMVNSMRSIEDAFVQMATTGKFEFEQLVNSILADITRLMVRESITKPLGEAILGGFSGGGGGFLGDLFGGLFGGFRQFGGRTEPGKAYVVGEKRPELFVPDQPGTILPSVPQGGGAAPTQIITNVNMHVHGVTDVDSFRRSEAQLMTRIQGQMDRAASRRS